MRSILSECIPALTAGMEVEEGKGDDVGWVKEEEQLAPLQPGIRIRCSY